MNIQKSLGTAFGLLLLLGQSVAFAVPVLTSTSQATINGTTTIDSDTSSTLAQSSVSDSFPPPFQEYQTSGAVDAAGNIGVSASLFGASGRFANDLTTQSVWQDTFDFAAGDSATFDFFIPSAVIAFEANNVGGLSGDVGVTVVLNGATIFSTFAQVATVANSPQTAADLALGQFGTDELTATFATGLAPGFGLGGAGYSFGAFTGSLSLNPLVGSNELTYTMQASVRGLIGETSAIASIGDPLNLAVGPGSAVNVTPGTPVNVAEPAPLMMLALGLFAACAARRSRRG